MKKEMEITKEDIEFLKQLKIYYAENDKIMFEHKAYPMLDSLVKKLHLHYVSKSDGVVAEDLFCGLTQDECEHMSMHGICNYHNSCPWQKQNNC